MNEHPAIFFVTKEPLSQDLLETFEADDEYPNGRSNSTVLLMNQEAMDTVVLHCLRNITHTQTSRGKLALSKTTSIPEWLRVISQWI